MISQTMTSTKLKTAMRGMMLKTAMTKTMMKYNIEDKEEDENMRRSDI